MPVNRTMQRTLLAAALVVAALLYSVRLRDDLYGDEVGHTWRLINQASSVWSVVDASTTHPPAFFVLAKAAYRLFDRPWAVRLPSVLFALATILLLPLAARDLLGERYRLPAAWLSAFSPFLLEFAVEGRSYTMVVFLSVASFWALTRLIRLGRTRDLIVVLALSCLGMLTHYFFFLQVLAMGVIYGVEKKSLPDHLWKLVLIAGGLLATAVAALIVGFGSEFVHRLQGDWAKSYFSLANFIVRLPVVLSYGTCTFRLPNLDPARNFTIAMVRDNLATVTMSVVALAGLLVAWIRLWKAHLRWYRALTLGIAVPTGIALIVGELGFYLLREKHLAVVWVCVALAQLLAIEWLLRSVPGRVVVGCHVAVVVVSAWHFLAQPDEFSRRMNWTGLNRSLEEQLQPADHVVYYKYDFSTISVSGLPVLERGFSHTRLAEDTLAGQPIEVVARRLDDQVPGRIFLVDFEEGRNAVDPSSSVIRLLSEKRTLEAKPFGRNLVLYRFSRRSQAGTEGASRSGNPLP